MAAVAEGYPFPTKLDRRAPATGGMAPESEVDIVVKGLQEDWSREQILEEMEQLKKASEA